MTRKQGPKAFPFILWLVPLAAFLFASCSQRSSTPNVTDADRKAYELLQAMSDKLDAGANYQQFSADLVAAAPTLEAYVRANASEVNNIDSTQGVLITAWESAKRIRDLWQAAIARGREPHAARIEIPAFSMHLIMVRGKFD